MLSYEPAPEAAVLCTGLECEGTFNLALVYTASILSVFWGQYHILIRI